MTVAAVNERTAWYLNRWAQLVLGVIAMMAISSPQYVWTLFTGPLNQKLGTTLAELQWTFSLLDHSADLVVTVSGLSGRPLRAAAPYFDRRAPFRRQLGGVVLCRQHLGALFHLWRARRLRHRHHLCRHYRPDGAVVSRPARARDRPRRGGLRLRRVLHQLPDRQHDQKLRLCPRAGGVGHHPGRDRDRRGARLAHAAAALSRRRAPRPRSPRRARSRAGAAIRRARCSRARCSISCSS